MKTRKRIGLALGSGSSRGWAHIGVIEALEEEGIVIDFIAGASIGSYVGALYAAGSMKSLKDFIIKMDGKRVFSYFDVTFPRSGFLNGTRKVKELYYMHTRVEDFSELDIPVKMVATELETGDKVVIDSGSIVDALRATMSVPGMFEPALVNGRWLVDGGLVDPVPVGVARAMGADIVIAVDLNSGLTNRRRLRGKSEKKEHLVNWNRGYDSEFIRKLTEQYEKLGYAVKERLGQRFSRDTSVPHIMDVVGTSINIMQERIARINLAVEPADVLIQPRLSDLSMMDFDQVERAIEEGYTRMKDRIEELRSLLQEE